MARAPFSRSQSKQGSRAQIPSSFLPTRCACFHRAPAGPVQNVDWLFTLRNRSYIHDNSRRQDCSCVLPAPSALDNNNADTMDSQQDRIGYGGSKSREQVKDPYKFPDATPTTPCRSTSAIPGRLQLRSEYVCGENKTTDGGSTTTDSCDHRPSPANDLHAFFAAQAATGAGVSLEYTDAFACTNFLLHKRASISGDATAPRHDAHMLIPMRSGAEILTQCAFRFVVVFDAR